MCVLTVVTVTWPKQKLYELVQIIKIYFINVLIATIDEKNDLHITKMKEKLLLNNNLTKLIVDGG